MKRDFTQTTYKNLLLNAIDADYLHTTFEKYLSAGELYKRIIILRHDVDRYPQNALALAKIEHNLDVKASYYFRFVKESYNDDIIKEIVALGHEIGYHYEDLSLVKGNYEIAIKSFQSNLGKLRRFYRKFMVMNNR